MYAAQSALYEVMLIIILSFVSFPPSVPCVCAAMIVGCVQRSIHEFDPRALRPVHMTRSTELQRNAWGERQNGPQFKPLPSASTNTTNTTTPASPPAKSDEVHRWAVSDVTQWLAELDPVLRRYAPAFEAQRIDGAALLALSEAELSDKLGGECLAAAEEGKKGGM